MSRMLEESGFEVVIAYRAGNTMLTTGMLLGYGTADYSQTELQDVLSPLFHGEDGYFATLYLARRTFDDVSDDIDSPVVHHPQHQGQHHAVEAHLHAAGSAAAAGAGGDDGTRVSARETGVSARSLGGNAGGEWAHAHKGKGRPAGEREPPLHSQLRF